MATDDADGSLIDLIEEDYGVEISCTEPNFLTSNWWWQGSTDVACPKCKNSLDVYRRPFEQKGMRYQYWAIACVTCLTLSTLDALLPELKKSIKAEYYLPPEPSTNTSFDPASVAKQSKSSVRFEETAEQKAAVAAVRKYRKLGIQALAGTGKTTTLTLIAKEFDNKNIQYIAFNRAIVEDVKQKMPSNVACNTAHSLAYRAVGYKFKDRLGAGGLKDYRKIASALDIARFHFRLKDMTGVYSSPQIAQLANMAVATFVKTVDSDLMLHHVESQIHSIIDDASLRNEIAEYVLPIARLIWKDITSDSGLLPFQHDHYLKLWQMTHPRIDKDLILFDEAQDADPVMVDVVSKQPHAQLVFCGDSFQQIYEWRGAKDAMRAIQLDHETWLTKSFRFGNEIAIEANEILAHLSDKVRVQGLNEISSTRRTDIRPNVVLCRTNAGLMTNIATFLAAGYRVATTVDRSQLIFFFKECLRLQNRQDVTHHELSAFNSWGELEEWTTNFPREAGELASMVRLVNKFGAARLMQSLEQCGDEGDSNIVVTTAHRAKGREWNNVKIDSDFPHIDDMSDEDLRLIYVAVTRAKLNLDISSWESVERNPNADFLKLITSTGLPLPRLETVAKEKPRRRSG